MPKSPSEFSSTQQPGDAVEVGLIDSVNKPVFVMDEHPGIHLMFQVVEQVGTLLIRADYVECLIPLLDFKETKKTLDVGVERDVGLQ